MSGSKLSGSIVCGSIVCRASRSAARVGALWVGLSACGGAQDDARTTPLASTPSEPATVVAPAPRAPVYPGARAVLVDGVRGARVLDEVGDLRLVGGAGTIALVGPDGHVRASHRFAFGADGASGVFLTPAGGPASHAVVGNGDQDGFRGPWAGQLSRWDLDADTIEQLRSLGYAAPLLARVGPTVVAVSPAEGQVFGVTVAAVEEREEHVDQLGWAPGRPAECYVGDEDQAWLVRASSDGSLVLTESDSPVPETPPLATVPTAWPMSAVIGARGLPSVALEPSGGHLAISTSSTTLLLGPEGIGAELRGGHGVVFPREGLLRMGEITSPIAAPAHPSRSRFIERFIYPEDGEGGSSPEVAAFNEWRYQAEEAEADHQVVPTLALEPVCNSVAPLRCVRARVEGTQLVGWDFYDPARPTRALGSIAQREFPPGPGHTLVAPGGRWIRIFGASGATSLVPAPGAPRPSDPTGWDELEDWVELDTGWALLDPQARDRLVFVPFAGGRASERRFDTERSALSILDATHVLVWDGEATVEVVSVPTLVTERTITLGAAGPTYHCQDEDLVDADAVDAISNGCPIENVDGEGGYAITVSGDRAFWVDARLGDELQVHRASDGAEITVRVTTQGVLVSSASGAFEGSGAVLDHVVVREPGPVRSATLTAGADARARFERPGLVASFFGGRPLPTP